MDERSLANYLAAREVTYELLALVTARTVAEAAEGLGVPPGRIVKSLLCHADGEPLLALVPGDRELSLEKLQNARGSAEAKLASRKDVERVTGYAVGGVAPFDLRSPVPVLGDVRLRELDEVICGGGSTRHLLRVSVSDLERLTGLTWFDLSVSGEESPAGRPT